MGFLDNSGDIILDAVLTDAGRERLARGDGSFKVIKFALGDDEINYTNYNKSAASNSKDLEILQTPVLEAFTNNTSLMKSKLITITRTDLLYLPVIKLNGSLGVAKYSAENVVLVTSDETTTNGMTMTFWAAKTCEQIRAWTQTPLHQQPNLIQILSRRNIL